MNTMLSRSGRSNPDGKLTNRLDIPVSDELNEAVIALAAIAGIPKAEYARRTLERMIFGDLSMLRRISGHHRPEQSDESGSFHG